MIPNANLIERWAVDDTDGYTKIPTSAFSELLWVLQEAEKVEHVMLREREWSVLDASGVRTTGFANEAAAKEFADSQNGAQAQWRTVWADADADA